MSDTFYTATCKSCGNPVIFALDEQDTPYILDLSAPMFIRIIPSLPGQSEYVQRTPYGWVSHVAVCPAADQFSQNKKCVCGHGKRNHPDGACENQFCSCPGFHVEQSTTEKGKYARD